MWHHKRPHCRDRRVINAVYTPGIEPMQPVKKEKKRSQHPEHSLALFCSCRYQYSSPPSYCCINKQLQTKNQSQLTHKQAIPQRGRDAISLPQCYLLGLQLELPRVLLLAGLLQLVVVLAAFLHDPDDTLSNCVSSLNNKKSTRYMTVWERGSSLPSLHEHAVNVVTI